MNKMKNESQKPFASTYAAYAASPDDYLSIEGVPPEIAARLPGFVDFGLDGDILVEAVRKAGPERGPATPGWCEVMMTYGHQAMERGEQAEKEADHAQAEWYFLEGSFWYFFARFPHILSEKAVEAYALHNDAYLRAAKHSAYPIEIIDIIIDGKKGRAFLRFPEMTQSQVPVMMISGGVDTWKSEIEVHHLSHEFLKNGMATLLIDIPGTGECPLFADDESAHRWFLAALDALKQHPRIDGSKMGFYGLSFGGYWSTKLALLCPWLSGVVNNGGPVHHTFQPSWVQNLPFGLKVILAKMLNIAPNSNPQVMIDLMGNLSLYKQGYFPANQYAPILGINGAEDAVVPIRDLYFLGEQGIKQDMLVFARDRHVASRHWRLHENFAVQWMVKKFQRGG